MNRLEQELWIEFPSANTLDIKRKALYILYGQKEQLNYVGGKYIGMPAIISVVTIFVTIILGLSIPKGELWPVFVPLLIGIVMVFVNLSVQHASTEKGLFKVTSMINVLEQQILDIEEDNTGNTYNFLYHDPQNTFGSEASN